MFDTAIIGSGPAGLSAALTLKSLNINFIWFGDKEFSTKVKKAERISNYPGLINISGVEFVEAFQKQIEAMDIQIEDKRVTGVYNLSTHYGILCDQEMFEAKTIILATGVESLKPIKGEIDYLGRGVSYCATCDGMLYKNKNIGVIITSKNHEHEIDFLADICNSVKVFASYKDFGVNKDNVEVIKGFVKEIVKGDGNVTLKLKDEDLTVDGVFVLKDSVSPDVLVPGLEIENSHVVVDRMGKTNLNGCFACGDVTGRPYQYAKAVGEGNVCAHSVNAYLHELKK